MIRFTWLQSRTQTAAAFGALAVVAVALAVTGPHLVSLYNSSVANCAAHGDCPSASTAFLRNDGTLRTWLGVLTVVLPGVIGIFWGAPLVARELEAGTFRLAWTQSVTRTRWLAVKLGVIGLASMAVAGLASLMVTWWASPLDRVHMSLFGTFDQRDIVPIGYAAFAFALGVAAGCSSGGPCRPWPRPWPPSPGPGWPRHRTFRTPGSTPSSWSAKPSGGPAATAAEKSAGPAGSRPAGDRVTARKEWPRARPAGRGAPGLSFRPRRGRSSRRTGTAPCNRLRRRVPTRSHR